MGIDDKMDQAKGRAQQAAGDITDNEDLKREGQKDETKGKIKGAVDNAADKISNAVNKADDKT